MLYSSFSNLPNFKGKLFFLEKYYSTFLKGSGYKTTSTWTGVKLSLFLEDRIQRRIYVKKSHEKETEIHMLKFAEKGKCFLDIGANVGYFSLMIAHRFPETKVYSFEPNPNNLKSIKANSKLNNLSNMQIIDLCLSDLPGKVEFAVPPENESGWGRMNGTNTPLENFTKINSQASSLDHLLLEGFFGKSVPSLIKIDIEGFEEKALRGGQQLINLYKPVLCVELNETCLKENGSSSLRIMNLILSWGYEAFYIESGKLVKTRIPRPGYRLENYFFIPS